MIDYSTIPGWVREEIDEWAAIASWPGTFVEAVLRNDLNDAFAKATEDEVRTLHSIVAYVYNFVPSPCWRSREKMVAWREMVVEAFEKALGELLEKSDVELSEDAKGSIRRSLANQYIANQRERSIGARQSG